MSPCFLGTAVPQNSTTSGISVTTPITIPGMPPITVNATLPYSAFEGLHIDPQKSAPA